MNLLLTSLTLLSVALVTSAIPDCLSGYNLSSSENATSLERTTIAPEPKNALPEQFYGRFTLDHSENFDEYLEAVGYSWFTRKLVTLATFEKVFTRGAHNTFDYENLTTKKNVGYKGVSLGREFEGEGLDSEQHKITFFMRDGKLVEKHIPINRGGEAKDEEYEYYFDGDFLLVRMEANGVVGKRFYKRVSY